MSPNVSAPRGTDASWHAVSAGADKIERSEGLTNILRTGREKKRGRRKGWDKGKKAFTVRVLTDAGTRDNLILTNIQIANFVSNYRVQNHGDACITSFAVKFRVQMQVQFTRVSNNLSQDLKKNHQ